MIVLPDLYVDLRYLRHNKRIRWWMRALWWMPGIFMAAYTLWLTLQKDFAPDDNAVLNTYLFLLGLIVNPKFVFAVCSVTGWIVSRLRGSRRNYGNWAGGILAATMIYILIYGSTIGFSKLDVRHVEFESASLPAEFDGYRIVQFSDAHVGTYGLSRQQLLRNAVDSINAQQADMIVFTGDLQNMQPREIRPHKGILSSLHAADGVFSILGNHDYADYIKADTATKAANCREIISMQRQMGWTLLLNSHCRIYRKNSSIVIAGMENDGDKKRFPQRGDLRRALTGTESGDFTVMLQHDPSCWRRKILPQSSAQLTLSGHTHAMQFELFGWSPAALVYAEWGGMYYDGSRAMNVSTGLGGFVPFRFGVPGEIVVITLRKGSSRKPGSPQAASNAQAQYANAPSA